MSWLRASKGQKPDYTGLQLQTSVTTLPIPIGWGQFKISPNVIWYENFQSQGGSGGKGHLFSGGSSSQTITYTADIIMALCEGPIAGIGQIWKDQSVYFLSTLGLTQFNGSTPQSVWGYLSSNYSAQAIAYQGTAYVCAASYQLGQTAGIGNHNFEIFGNLWGSGINGIDADPALVIQDFLTNSQYGAGFPSSSINTSTLLGSSGDSSLQTYCRALGLAFSPVLTTQEQASSVLARWLQICNCAAVWSGSQLKFIPYADAAIAGRSNLSAIAASTVPTPSMGGTAEIVVCGASEWISDGGVKYALRNVAMTYVGGSSAPSSVGQYAISPNGTYLFNAGDAGAAVQIIFNYASPYSFNPNLTPIYALTDEDFVDPSGNNDPVQVSRLDPYTLPNIQRVECCSRSNQYATIPVEARDQSQIELYGPRVGSTITAHEICDELNVGPIVAQTLLQRQLYIRQHFTFTLSWEYCLLEPMDIVEISDANLGISALAVRIVSIEEDETGHLKVEAEELTVGISTPVLYAMSAATANTMNRGVAAEPVNTPLIYEAPPALTGGVAQLWLGASGGAGGVVDPNWGGANIWLSLDDSTYSQIGTITAALRQGVLTASLASASGWDTTNTLAVNLAESGSTLSGTSLTSAQAGATLAVIDSELVAYESATLTGTYAYALTGLQRGLYSTTPTSHSSGAPFARLDGSVFKYNLPNAYIGKTVYLKFQSFNVFGLGLQSLAACTAYSHALVGAGVAFPSDITGFGAALTLDGATYTLAGQWTADPNATSYIVQWSLDGSTNWNTVYAGSDDKFSSKGWGYIATLYLRVEGVNGAFVSPSWTQITISQGPQTTVDAANAGLYIQFDDLSGGLGDDWLSQFGVADQQILSTLSNVLAQDSQNTALSVSLNGATATFTNAINVQVAANAALATDVTTLSATIAGVGVGVATVGATVTSNYTAQATTNAAVASDITTLNANYSSLSSTVSSNYLAQATENASLASSITSVAAVSNAGTANGSMQLVALSSLGSGVAAAYQIEVSTTVSGSTFQYAGMRLEALSSGTSQVVIEADQFIVENGSTKTVVFGTNSDGTLQLQGVTKVATTIISLGSGTDGQPYMSINFGSSPSIIIDDGS